MLIDEDNVVDNLAMNNIFCPLNTSCDQSGGHNQSFQDYSTKVLYMAYFLINVHYYVTEDQHDSYRVYSNDYWKEYQVTTLARK